MNVLESNEVLKSINKKIELLEMINDKFYYDNGNYSLLIHAKNEIIRLLEGNFTEDEFQNLCHNFSEDDQERFKKGCKEYQKKLFGENFRCD